MMRSKSLVLAALLALASPLWAQMPAVPTVEVTAGIDYEIGGILVTGADELDPAMVTLLSGLRVGDQVQFPSEKVSSAIRNLWKQELFEDVQLFITARNGGVVYLEFKLRTLPKLSKYYFEGISKARQDALREKLGLSRGTIVSPNLLRTAEAAIRKHFVEKGFPDVRAKLTALPDTEFIQTVVVKVEVEPGPRLRIDDIVFTGNSALQSGKLRRSMDELHRLRWWNIFQSAKYLEDKLEGERALIVEAYNHAGYRDARIVRDTVYRVDVKDKPRIRIEFAIEEGRPYYYRSVRFLGNSKYDNATLQSILKIEAGDRYDSKLLATRVNGDPNGNDISSLYLNNGFLFSNVIPVEARVENDSIDLEIRIREGRPATVRKVTVIGNDRTNDHVIYREIRTRPGDLFSKADIQRTIRELGQLGYFDPRSINITPNPDPMTGSVDLEYTVSEQSTSQLELQGGWGANMVIGRASCRERVFRAV